MNRLRKEVIRAVRAFGWFTSGFAAARLFDLFFNHAWTNGVINAPINVAIGAAIIIQWSLFIVLVLRKRQGDSYHESGEASTE
jgi:hypothetical protein